MQDRAVAAEGSDHINLCRQATRSRCCVDREREGSVDLGGYSRFEYDGDIIVVG